MSARLERVHLLISGRVQGVFYRVYTQRQAHHLELTGWVRNLPDGRVEAQAEGPREALEALVAWCREGPELAQVQGVEVKWEAALGDWSDFEVEPRRWR